MASKSDKRIAKLEKQLADVQAALQAVRDSAKVKTLVRSKITGPRVSDVFVDAQAMPLTGRFIRSGEREVELDEPISVFAGLKGQVGTDSVITTEINGKKKEEKVTMKSEKEFHSFEYKFSDFGIAMR